MLTLALVVMLAQTDVPQRVIRTDRVPRRGGRGGSLAPAFFEFAPASGAGMGAACACAAVTGSKGEAMTFTRASSATCTPSSAGGLTNNSIANASLVECASDQPRVEYAASGPLGLRNEGARTNVLLRFIDYANATWADVGTPTLTGSQVSPFTGTYANLAVQVDDNDGAAYEGRSQSVTVSAATAYFMHCYVKAGTLDQARITLDGTAATITGLSSTTWSIIEVGDASSSGVAISAQVMNGDATSDTGTVIWGGCQVEAGTYRTSIIPTTGATATRATEQGARFSLSGVTTTMSAAASAYTDHAVSVTGPQWLSLETTYGEAVPKALGYGNSGFASTFVAGTLLSTGAAWTSGVHRLSMDTDRNARFDGTAASTGAVTLSAPPTVVVLSGNGAAGAPLDGIVFSVCVDPSPLRCR